MMAVANDTHARASAADIPRSGAPRPRESAARCQPVLVTVRALALARLGDQFLQAGMLATVPMRTAIHAARFGLVEAVAADALDVELGLMLQDVIPKPTRGGKNL